MQFVTLFICVFIVLVNVAYGSILRVPDIFDQIQAAIEAAEPGDTVLVARGVYNERINFSGKNIVVASHTIIEDDNSAVVETIIDAERRGGVATLSNNEGAGAVLTGFTLRNGLAQNGGGIYIMRASPTLYNLIVENCEAALMDQTGGMGGGIYSAGARPTLYGIEVIGCRAIYGGGVVLRDANVDMHEMYISENVGLGSGGSPSRAGAVILMSGTFRVTDSHIVNNTSHGGGAGIYTARATATIEGCTIAGNRADQQSGSGAGLSINNASSVLLKRCLIYDNIATNTGGAMSVFQSTVDISNCNITANSTGESGKAIYLLDNAKVVVVNSILWNNERGSITFSEQFVGNLFAAAYSCIQYGQNAVTGLNGGRIDWLDGNITEDPMFLNPEEADFNLWDISPCIDAGIAQFEYERRLLVNLSPEDYYGDAPDIGYVEFRVEDHVAPGVLPPAQMALLRVCPNPFNGYAKVSFVLPVAGKAILKVFDLYGREIESLFSGVSSSGTHDFTWDANGFSSGMYYLRLETGNQALTSRVYLIK